MQIPKARPQESMIAPDKLAIGPPPTSRIAQIRCDVLLSVLFRAQFHHAQQLGALASGIKQAASSALESWRTALDEAVDPFLEVEGRKTRLHFLVSDIKRGAVFLEISRAHLAFHDRR